MLTERSVLRQRTSSLRRLASGHKVSDIQSNCKKVKTSEDADFVRPHPSPQKIVPLTSSSFSLLVWGWRGGRVWLLVS